MPNTPFPPPTSFPKTQIKVLLLENVHASAHELFDAEGFQVEALGHALKDDELAAKIENVHVLGIRSKTQVRAPVLAKAKRLLSLGCFCIGTNQVELDDANRRGVPVFNAPFSNTRSVAEMILAEIVVLSRQIGDRSREVHEGVWKKTAAGCHEVRGKTLGLIGYGHIGRQLGVVAESLGMRVVFYDIATRLPMGNNRPVPALGELLEQSDFVSLHVPETAATKGMIGPEELSRMKKGAHLLNASRGTVVQIPALAEALKKKHLAGAAIDVFPEEPEENGPGFASELRGVPNVLLTPHIGGSTLEAQEAIGKEVAVSLIRYVNTGATTGAVNFPQVEVPAPKPRTHRILNVHKNVPGVLRDINRIVSERNANIESQILSTDNQIGYLMMDIAHDVAEDVRADIAALETNIRTRILY